MPMDYIIILLIGFVVLHIIFMVGGFLSRYYGLNLIYLSLLSTFFYTAIAYVGAAQINTMSGISLSGLLGLYEAVLGFKILRWLKADIDIYQQALEPMLDQNGFLHPLLVAIMVLVYMFIGWMGTLLV
jgi:hypothetical protein